VCCGTIAHNETNHFDKVCVLTIVGLAVVRLATIRVLVALFRRIAAIGRQRYQRAVSVGTFVAVVALRLEQMTDLQRRLARTIVVDFGQPIFHGVVARPIDQQHVAPIATVDMHSHAFGLMAVQTELRRQLKVKRRAVKQTMMFQLVENQLSRWSCIVSVCVSVCVYEHDNLIKRDLPLDVLQH
jgi:hypothetical protein